MTHQVLPLISRSERVFDHGLERPRLSKPNQDSRCFHWRSHLARRISHVKRPPSLHPAIPTALITRSGALSQVAGVVPVLLLKAVHAVAVVLVGLSGLDLSPCLFALLDDVVRVVEAELGVAVTAALTTNGESCGKEENGEGGKVVNMHGWIG